MVKVKFNKEKKEWDVLEKGSKEGMYVDGYLKQNLDILRAKIKEDRDFFLVVDGEEGSGKSVLAQQVGYYLDPTLTIDRIAFTPERFKEICINAKKYEVVIFDEAMRGMDSSRTMRAVNQSLKEMAAEIRQKNLFVIIVLPTFFELMRYIAVWRSKFLLHVYQGDNMTRGFFRFYDSTGKKIMYLMGKRTYHYGAGGVKSSFYGRFMNYYTVDEKEYREKKLEELKSKNDSDTEHPFQKIIDQRDTLVHRLINVHGESQTFIGDKLGMSQQRISGILKKSLEK